MLAYIMIKDGQLEVIPVDVDVKNMTYIVVKNRRLGRKLLYKHLEYHIVNGRETPVFILPRAEFDQTDQPE